MKMQVLCTLLLLSALAGCGSNTPPASSVPVSSEAVSSAPVSSAPVSSVQSAVESTASSETPSAVDTQTQAGITMSVQYYEEKSGDVLEIPHFKDDSDAAAALNQKLDAIAAQYQRFMEPSTEEFGEWCEVLCYPAQTDRYLQVVLHQNTFPIYGTDGTLSVFNYDTQDKKELSLEDIMQLDGTSQADIQAAFDAWAADWIKTEETQTPEGGKATAVFKEVLGGRILPSGKAEYYLSITIGREMATEWTRIYVLREGAIEQPLGEDGKWNFIPPQAQIPMEPPLWNTRTVA